MNLIEVLQFTATCWLINLGLNLFKFIPRVKQYDRPLDAEKNFIDHRRLLGPSTTLLGFPFAILFGLIFGSIFYNWQISLVLGFSAYFGHALGSFIKRRLGIKPGGYLPLVDHGDFIITAGLFLYLLNIFSLQLVFYAVLLTWVVQPVLCYIGYRLKLREYPL